VAREAGLIGFCDALLFCGLADEMPELCAAGMTVLAPTDAAFAQLARKTRCSKRLVRHILLAHLSTGVSMLRDLHARRCVAALGGQTHAAVLEGGCTYVGTARVSRADIPFDGGVIHEVSVYVLGGGVRWGWAGQTHAAELEGGCTYVGGRVHLCWHCAGVKGGYPV
jgi:hypothetical protein